MGELEDLQGAVADLERQINKELVNLLRSYHGYGDRNSRPAGSRTSSEELLWHYTNIDSLKGILEGGSLWATHHKYLNDATEVVHGWELIDRAIEERAQAHPAHIKGFLKRSCDQGRDMLEDRTVYISCFCERDDLLSQWRSYGTGGGGCAIGFGVRSLLAEGDSDHRLLDSGFGLTKVLYEEEHKLLLVHGVIDNVISMLEEYVRLKPLFADNPQSAAALDFNTIPLVTAIIHLLVGLSYKLKHHAFKEEQEWRVFGFRVDSRSVREVKFRTKDGLLIPFIEIPIRGEEAGAVCLEVRRIRCGPTSKPDRQRKSIEMLLTKNGLQGVPVDESTIPLRA